MATVAQAFTGPRLIEVGVVDVKIPTHVRDRNGSYAILKLPACDTFNDFLTSLEAHINGPRLLDLSQHRRISEIVILWTKRPTSPDPNSFGNKSQRCETVLTPFNFKQVMDCLLESNEVSLPEYARRKDTVSVHAPWSSSSQPLLAAGQYRQNDTCQAVPALIRPAMLAHHGSTGVMADERLLPGSSGAAWYSQNTSGSNASVRVSNGAYRNNTRGQHKGRQANNRAVRRDPVQVQQSTNNVHNNHGKYPDAYWGCSDRNADPTSMPLFAGPDSLCTQQPQANHRTFAPFDESLNRRRLQEFNVPVAEQLSITGLVRPSTLDKEYPRGNTPNRHYATSPEVESKMKPMLPVFGELGYSPMVVGWPVEASPEEVKRTREQQDSDGQLRNVRQEKFSQQGNYAQQEEYPQQRSFPRQSSRTFGRRPLNNNSEVHTFGQGNTRHKKRNGDGGGSQRGGKRDDGCSSRLFNWKT